MEDIKQLLEQSNAYSMSSSDENGSESDSLYEWRFKNISQDFSYVSNNKLEIKTSTSVTTIKRNGEKRLPTRRPDPNVYNRNALLARENRRRKKIYLETIEKELRAARKANRALAKALRRQWKIAQQLEKEKKYAEKLLTSRSDILNPVNAFNCQVPESEESPFSTINKEDYNSYSSSSQDDGALLIKYDGLSDGSVTAPFDCSLCDFSSFDFCTFPDFSADLDDGSFNSLPTSWDDVLEAQRHNIGDLSSSNLSLLSNDNILQCFNDDHSYVLTSKASSIEDPEQKNDCSDYIDVEGGYRDNGQFYTNFNWSSAFRNPPLQLLSEQPSDNLV